MSFTTAEGREQLLDELAIATDALASAIAALGEAYELVDEHTGDELEAQLFRPVQVAYGRAQRTHAQFAERHGLPSRTFETTTAGLPSTGVKGFIESAVADAQRADHTLSELQDSMLPVEVGDPEVRAGLAEVRELLGTVSSRARDLLRHLGR